MKRIISVVALVTVLALTLSSCSLFVAKKTSSDGIRICIPENAGKSDFYLVESVDGKNLTLVEGRYERQTVDTAAPGPIEVPVDGEGEITRDAEGRGIEMPIVNPEEEKTEFVTNGVKITADFSECKFYKQNGPEAVESSIDELKANDIVKIDFDSEGKPYAITVV